MYSIPHRQISVSDEGRQCARQPAQSGEAQTREAQSCEAQSRDAQSRETGAPGQLGRAVAVLDVVAERGSATPAEIGRRLGLAKSTVHRLLGVLQAHGLVFRATEGFRLGGRAQGWVDWEQVALIARLRQLALPYLVELRGQVGTAVALGVRSRDAVAYPERLYDLSQLALLAPLRPLSPAHATAAGKVLLAFAPAADRPAVAAPELPRYTSATITSPRALAEELARVRESGLATACGELSAGLTALAAPIGDRRRRVVAAIAIAGPAEQVLGPARARAVRAAAAAVSGALRASHAAEPSVDQRIVAALASIYSGPGPDPAGPP